MLIYDPGNLIGTQRNQTFDHLCELRDIMPTLLDIAGIDIPESVEGESLLPVIKGKNPEWRQYVHGEHSFGMRSNQYIVTKTEKYVWYSRTGEEQFFDLASDPDELRNRVTDPAYKNRVDELRKILIRELDGREEGFTDGQKLKPVEKTKDTLDFVKYGGKKLSD